MFAVREEKLAWTEKRVGKHILLPFALQGPALMHGDGEARLISSRLMKVEGA
jgi:hypothetical protein